MLENLFIVFVVLIGLLAACRMILEYWLRSQRHLPYEEVSNLTFLEKVTFAFGHFCDRIQKSRELRNIKMEEEFGKKKML